MQPILPRQIRAIATTSHLEKVSCRILTESIVLNIMVRALVLAKRSRFPYLIAVTFAKVPSTTQKNPVIQYLFQIVYSLTSAFGFSAFFAVSS